MAIQVLIDGLDRTDFLSYVSGRIGWNLMRGNRGTCNLPFIIPPGSTFVPLIGQYLEIFDDGQREWAGTIETAKVDWLGDDGWHIATATGVTLDSRIDGTQLDKQQVASLADSTVTCGEAFTQLFTSAAIPGITLGTVEDGPDIEALNATNLKDAFDTIARIAGKIWYFDPRDLTVNMHDAGLRPADWVLEDQPTSAEGGVLWESMQWSQSRNDFADTQVTQLPERSIAAQTKIFDGDDTTTIFTFDSYPEYVVSADVDPEGSGSGTPLGHDIVWKPGSNQISCTPAMYTGQSLICKWLDSGQVIVSNPAFGATVGHRARRYTRTRTFTRDGTIQEATAMLALYSMLPAQAQLTTDRPGISIARKWQVNISSPTEAAGLMNGYWQVVEVEAEIVPGMDRRDAPFGHFRYTLHLVNFLATAIFQGDGEATRFTIPGTGEGAVIATSVLNSDTPHVVTIPGIALPQHSDIDPAPEPGATVITQYDPGAGARPDVQPFPDTWEQMFPDSGLDPIPFAGDGDTGGEVPTGQVAKQFCIRTLTLRDLTVGDDIAPHTCAYHAGVGLRVLATLRKPMFADLVVMLHLGLQDIEITVPDGTSVGDVLDIPLVFGSPPVTFLIEDKVVFTADITASDGQKDVNGVAQLTIEWEYD